MSSAARQYGTTPDRVATSRPRLVPARGMVSTRPAVPLSVVLLGIVSLLVAAWGAAAPFAGPDFGFVADRATAWQWSVTSACLGLGPGVIALLASLIVLGVATRTSYSRRPDLWLLGLVIALCGAWFVVGQYVWPVIYGKVYIAPSNVSHFMWKELAFAIGPGVILVFCGAVFMGWAVRRQLALVTDRLPGASSVPSAPVTGTSLGSAPGPSTGTMAPPPPAAQTVPPPAPSTGPSAQGTSSWQRTGS
jgi:hypothetical protein